MFGFIRLIIGCLLWIFAFCIIRKTTLVHKRRYYIISAMITVVLVSVSAFVPLENAFLTFDSPESAYSYYNFGNTEVKLVVSGQDSDLVIGDKNNSDVYLIVPKTTDGWKVGIGIDTKRVSQKTVNGVVVYVYQYQDTNDYFVTVLDANGEILTITDSRKSSFLSLVHENDTLGKNFASFYANVPDLDRAYWLDINGKTVSIFEDAGAA